MRVPTHTADELEFHVHLHQEPILANVPVGFDLGLPLLGLDVDGQVQLKLNFDWDLTFGLNREGGFYIVTGTDDSGAGDDEIRLGLEATLADGFAAQGHLGPLQVDVTDGAMINDELKKTHLVGNLSIDLKDPSGPNDDHRLTVDELNLQNAANIVQAVFPNNEQNRADVRLHLVGSVEGDSEFPTIETDLVVGWSFAGALAGPAAVPEGSLVDGGSPAAAPLDFGQVPDVSFLNVEFDPGQVIETFAKPILDKVNAVLAPIEPILAVLQTPLPIISDLAGRPFTILDVAEQFATIYGGEISPETRQFIKAAIDLVNLASFVEDVSATGKVRLGDFQFGGAGGMADLRSTDLSSIDPGTLAGASNAIDYSQLGSVSEFRDMKPRVPAANGSGAGFSMPILDNPLGVLEILFGRQDVDLFKYDMPQLKIVSPFQFLIPIIPPFLVGFFGGNIGAQMDFNFGFDTSGIFNGNPMDGFYVEDTVGGRPGASDPVEASLFGAIEVGAEVGVALGPAKAVAGAAGGLFAEVGLNLNDPDHDGKVHLPELQENLSRGPEWVFDLQGKFDAYLRAFVDIEVDTGLDTYTIVDKSIELARVTLLDFSIPPRGEISTDSLATEVSPGVIELNFRQDQDDNFRIRQDASGSVIVSARGQTQSFSNVSLVKGNAGDGDDSVTFDDSVTTDVEISGGDGDDMLTYKGTGVARFWGEAGDDTLIGGSGDDILDGGAGSDRIIGNGGDDNLHGGSDDDEIHGGFGDDTLRGDGGDDAIYGETGDDVIYGGLGIDHLDGGLDNDILYGEADADFLTGGDGRDELHGGAGNDHIEGGLGNDTIYGDAGSDYLDGQRSNDVIFGGSDNDQIFGGPGSDELYGEAGNDTIISGMSSSGGDKGAIHHIEGGSGNDVIYGDVGQDTIFGDGQDPNDQGPIFGGTKPLYLQRVQNIFGYPIDRGSDGNDQIYSLAGNDTIDAGDGDDWIVAGTGSDNIIGGWGRDTIYAGVSTAGGGSAADVNTVYGDRADGAAMPGLPSDHADLIYGDVGDDVIRAGYGNDVLYGLQGSDFLEGGWQADIIYAGVNEMGGGSTADANTVYGDVQTGDSLLDTSEEHRDHIYGDVGPDTIFAGPSSDTVYALSGDDLIYAGRGDDTVDAGSGNDTIFGEGGADTIDAGADDDLVYGGANDDMLQGGEGDDFIVGGTGDDTITGGSGSDVLWGGTEVISFDAFQRDVLTDFAYPTNFPGQTWNDIRGMQRIVPVALAGLSVEGDADDGMDTIRGDEGNDWIFGGGADDDLAGGSGVDYVDGGAGNDSVAGDEGDDVVRGGSGDDVLRGGTGIDQLFGDAGADYLFADAGVSVSGETWQNQQFQRSFGGDGIDYLYGYAQSQQLERHQRGQRRKRADRR